MSLHSSAIGGHSGQNATLQRLKLIFFWPGTKSEVVEYIQSCEVFQENKSEHILYPSLLQPLYIPNQT